MIKKKKKRYSDMAAIMEATKHSLANRNESLNGANKAILDAQSTADSLTKAILTAKSPSNPESTMGIPLVKETDEESRDFISIASMGNFENTVSKADSLLSKNNILRDKLFRDSPHFLSPADVSVALGIGMLSAVLPSLSIFGEKTSLRDLFHENQNGAIKDGIEKIMATDSASIAIDGTSGALHRFALDDNHAHDLLGAIFSPIEGVGFKQRFAHLLIDAFGATGVPLPGSTYLRQALHEVFTVSVPDKIHSRLAAYRHTDLASTGLTSALLWIFFQLQSIGPDSLRYPKISLISHGTCVATIAAIVPYFPKLAARRSWINYTSLVMVVRHLASINAMDNQLSKDANQYRSESEAIIRQLSIIYGNSGGRIG